jgi:glucose-1-phosphate thymidylyltransferase
VQPEPNGLAEAFILGEQFLAGGPSCLVLGDNIFHGHGLPATLASAARNNRGATIFGYQVRDPERYGVVEFGPDRRVVSIEEKPRVPKSNFAVPGIYFYDGRAPEFARAMKPSARGELEITDLNMRYLAEGSLTVELLGRGVAWLDTGTPASLAQASSFIETIEFRQGLKVCCPEEIAHSNRWIDDAALLQLARRLGDCSYADYLRELVVPRHGGA